MTVELDVTNFKVTKLKSNEGGGVPLSEFLDLAGGEIIKVAFTGTILTTSGVKAIDGIYIANQINPTEDGTLEYTSTSFDCNDKDKASECFDVILEHGVSSISTWVDAKSGETNVSIEKNNSVYLKLNRVDCNNVD